MLWNARGGTLESLGFQTQIPLITRAQGKCNLSGLDRVKDFESIASFSFTES